MSKIHPIPTDLIENVARGSSVLFLGADVAYDTADWSGPPARPQLAAALARQYLWVPPGLEWALAAEAFLSREPADHHGLISFVREQVETCAVPGPLHQLLVDLGFDAVVTNGYDSLLERAMQAAGRRILQVVGESEIAYAGGKEEVILIHLAGIATQPESLILTRRDQIRVENRLSEKLQAVRGWCALRPLLFIGWNPEDDSLRRLYYAATEKLGQHKRRNYIVWPTPSPQAIANWKVDNVEIIPAEPLTFLRALAQQVRQQRPLHSGYRPGLVVGKLPYKFLNYFDPEDRDIFCGREVEAPLVYRMALSYPLLTLFGQSGVGKTSLLRAGVVPLLLEEGYTYAYIRALGDPLQAVREGVCRALDREPCAAETLRDFFQTVLGETGRLVVILDQFEEFFRASAWTRRRFWRELRACLGMQHPEVRFVLSLREDFLPQLDEARRPWDDGEAAPIPTVLRDSYRLTALVADTAYLALVEPARRTRCTLEPQLTEVLLGRVALPDVENGAHWSLAEADGAVPPPALQIVMDRLYRQALVEAGHQPPTAQTAKTWEPPALTLTLALYRQLGGAGRILAEYVTRALDRVPEQGGDRAMAVALLKVLVTGQKTKAALDETDLLAGLAEADFDPRAADAVACLRTTRAALVNLRLLRSFQLGERTLYEPAHDHMAVEIATWIGETELQAKLARELLQRELESWRGLGKLVEPAALRLLHERRADLRRLSPEALELLLRSALAAGFEAAYWAQRARQGGVDVDDIAREGLRSENFRTRAAAVIALGQLGDAFVDDQIGMLADDYPQVRVAAIAALEHLRPDGEWRAHLKYECYVPAGKFVMGEGQEAHEVYLDAYYIGKYPVTNAEYACYAEDIKQPFDSPADKAEHPVVNVNWYDARNYAAWAGMRLLTEAEWEKAASWDETDNRELSARTTEIRRKSLINFSRYWVKDNTLNRHQYPKRQYPWGNQFDMTRCNTKESGIHMTVSVGKYSFTGDSPYGCTDMAGNVWEWTSSSYENYPYQIDNSRENADSWHLRVLRGGSFSYSWRFARTVYRHNLDPFLRSVDLGFRIGCSALPIS